MGRPGFAASIVSASLASFGNACEAPPSTSAPPPPAVSAATPSPSSGPIGTSAPLERAVVATPPEIAPADARPLVLFLHGLGDSGAGFERALGVPALARDHKFSFAVPDGTLDRRGRRFWNAGAACCDFDGLAPDHLGQIGSLPDALEKGGGARFDSVIVVGFSNGAFMAHRLACDVPRVTGIVAIAGAVPGPTDAPCRPTHPVRTVIIHGDADAVVPYRGGPVLRDTSRVVSSAADAAATWALHNGCGALGAPRRHDLVQKLDGDETRIEAYEGCREPVELWTVEGADHLGVISRDLVGAAVSRALKK
jgi:polyhydroxybutyrate depolymerase